MALKAKMYSIKTQSYWYPSPTYGETLIAKGVPKTAKKRLTHANYREILDNVSTSTTTFRTIRSRQHTNKTLEIRKRALSAYDDKKYILANGIDCLSYGHYKIN